MGPYPVLPAVEHRPQRQQPVRIPVVCLAGRLVGIDLRLILDPDDVGADEEVAVVLFFCLQPRGVELVEVHLGKVFKSMSFYNVNKKK